LYFVSHNHFLWESDSIPTDAIPTNAILTEMHIDRHVIVLYIHTHQGATITCVVKYDFALNIKFTVFVYSYVMVKVTVRATG